MVHVDAKMSGDYRPICLVPPNPVQNTI